MIEVVCPECVNGKHLNCTKMVLTGATAVGSEGTEVDVYKPCACGTCRVQRERTRRV